MANRQNMANMKTCGQRDTDIANRKKIYGKKADGHQKHIGNKTTWLTGETYCQKQANIDSRKSYNPPQSAKV